jgi:hypothetical protein
MAQVRITYRLACVVMVAVVVSFRGTQVESIKNWIDDIE